MWRLERAFGERLIHWVATTDKTPCQNHSAPGAVPLGLLGLVVHTYSQQAVAFRQGTAHGIHARPIVGGVHLGPLDVAALNMLNMLNMLNSPNNPHHMTLGHPAPSQCPRPERHLSTFPRFD